MYLKVAPSMLFIGFPATGLPLRIMCGKAMLKIPQKLRTFHDLFLEITLEYTHRFFRVFVLYWILWLFLICVISIFLDVGTFYAVWVMKGKKVRFIYVLFSFEVCTDSLGTGSLVSTSMFVIDLGLFGMICSHFCFG